MSKTKKFFLTLAYVVAERLRDILIDATHWLYRQLEER